VSAAFFATNTAVTESESHSILVTVSRLKGNTNSSNHNR